MKRFVVLMVLMGAILVGCSEIKKPSDDVYRTSGMVFHVVTIDSCEYVYFGDMTYSGGITHKGNCRFCAERAAQKEASE